MRKILAVVVATLLLTPPVTFAQEEAAGEVTKTGTTAANFLNLEIGAKAVALAGAFTAVADDATALKWNPAGMAKIGRLTGTYSNIDLYAGIRHQFVGLVVPAGINNVFGVSFNYVDIGKMLRTTEEYPDGFDLYFESYDMAVGLSYARNLTDRVAFGLTAKWVHEQIWEERADGYCFDFGVLYVPGLSGLQLGMSITNFGPDMKMDQGPLQTFAYEPREEQYGVGNRNVDARYEVGSYPMPVSFQMGLKLDLAGRKSLLLQNNSNRVSLLIEVNDAFDNPMRARYAIEYEWKSILAIRGGYKQNYDLASFTFGGGFKIPIRGMGLRFDYALADYGDLGKVNVTSIEIGF